jgi:glucose/mannose-6-phosphate isomerase
MDASLDSPDVSREYDRAGMLACLRDMPAQCQLAWEMAQDFEFPADFRQVDKVLILGMGGSAIGGEIASGLLAAELRVPISVWRDDILPAFVDSRTLVIASSFSGNTDETLAAFGQALQKDCQKLAITSGGKLEELAREKGVPLFHYSYRGQPRAALGFSLMPLLSLFQRLGFSPDMFEDVAEMLHLLRDKVACFNEDVPVSANPAKQLAQYLYGSLAVVYGTGGLGGVAHRWKTQLNENAKEWAFHEVFPELDHNAVVGYRFPAELADKIKVIMLGSPTLPAHIQQRYELTCRLLEEAHVRYRLLEGEGKSGLGQAMGLVLLGDYVSCYLAVLYGTDPTPVEAIDYIKNRMGG